MPMEVWGCMGAAAAASFLNDSSEDEILEGVRLGASFALPTMWSAALEGALVRNAYMGHCIESALRVPALVSAGFRAPEGVIDYVFGTVLGKAFNSAALKTCAGEWEIAGNYFKPYAFCRYTHAPIDALGMILGKEKISPEAVREITVETYSRASTAECTGSCEYAGGQVFHSLCAGGAAGHGNSGPELLYGRSSSE